MLIDELAARLYTELAPDAPRGTLRRHAATVGAHHVEVFLSIDHHGQRALRYYCDGLRITRQALRQLLCTETTCPESQGMKQQWRDHPRTPRQPGPVRRRPDPGPKPLITEVPVDAAGHHCVARPASFECLTPCPELAHEPRVLRKAGWDLFEDGVWVSGGLQLDAASGTARPRFATPQAARDWLIEQQQQAQGVLRACGPGPASTSD